MTANVGRRSGAAGTNGGGAASYQRAMVLVTASSMLVPVVGLISSPILAHSLGVIGRGETGAAMAPNLLIVGGATLGLPQALTFFLAKNPRLVRSALSWSALFATGLGLLGLVGYEFVGSYLAGGDTGLAALMLLGTWLAIPALLVGLLRGAATGKQMWTAVAWERSINSVLRLALTAGLAVTGHLTVHSAVVTMCVAPIVAGMVYLGVGRRVDGAPVTSTRSQPRLARDLLGFGSKVWLGSVATMLMARLSQLFVVPLAGAEQLGLLIVAITISDVPYIVTATVRDVIFGSNSAEPDTDRLLATSRVATVLAVAGSLLIGATLPAWIGIVFGRGFTAAIVPTWLLLLSSCVAVPGLIAGAGLDSAGRPGLKSLSLCLALAVNIVGIFFWVPRWGADGAAFAALISTSVSAVFAVGAASRVQGTAWTSFLVPCASDTIFVRALGKRLLGRVLPGRAR